MLIDEVKQTSLQVQLAQNLAKPGYCQAISTQPGSTIVCNGTFCTDDSQCPGTQKCCDDQCGSRLCADPVLDLSTQTCDPECPPDYRCELRSIACPPPWFCPAVLMPICVSRVNDNCGGCPMGDVCISTVGRCPPRNNCQPYQCAANNSCGGCPTIAVCESSTNKCVLSPHLNRECDVPSLKPYIPDCSLAPPVRHPCLTDADCSKRRRETCCADHCSRLRCVKIPIKRVPSKAYNED